MRIIPMTLLTLAGLVQIGYSQDPFTKVTTLNPGLGYSYAAWGDFDGDNDLDIVVCGALSDDSRVMKLYRNDDGSFTDIQSLPGLKLSSAEWGDYDLDGDLDLLVTGDDDDNLPRSLIYRNDNSVFTNSGIQLPGIDDGQATWGDFDNDGDLDILMAGRMKAIILRNDGYSGFQDIQAGLPSVQTATVAWGDYNNDGWLDALVGGDTGGGMVTCLYKNTSGTFKADTVTLPGLCNGIAKWGDLDKDGDIDLALDGMDGYTDGHLYLYRNDGNGTFSQIDSYSFPHAYSSLDLGDYDNDGLLDIILSGQIQGCGGAAVTLYFHNEGVMIFTDTETNIDGSKFGSAGWGDFNNDGYSDLLFTGINHVEAHSTVIYRNNSGDALFRSNTPPSVPSGTQSEPTGSSVCLKWNKSNDSQTAPDGLSYNIYIGTTPGQGDILSPMSDISTGKLMKSGPGNAGPDTSITITNLYNGTYFWSVQSVDNGFLGSGFAPVQSFTLTTSGILKEPDEELHLMPNPAKETLYISGVSQHNPYYEIFTPVGVRINSGIAGDGAIPLCRIKTGLYLIRIQDTNRTVSGIFIKE